MSIKCCPVDVGEKCMVFDIFSSTQAGTQSFGWTVFQQLKLKLIKGAQMRKKSMSVISTMDFLVGTNAVLKFQFQWQRYRSVHCGTVHLLALGIHSHKNNISPAGVSLRLLVIRALVSELWNVMSGLQDNKIQNSEYIIQD